MEPATPPLKKKGHRNPAKSSAALIEIARRVIKDLPHTFKEVKSLAASILAQSPRQHGRKRAAAKTALASLLLLSLTACTIKPFTTTGEDGRTIASLGASFATKSDYEVASITKPDGTVISYETGRHDETVVPVASIKAGVAKAGIASAGLTARTAIKSSATTSDGAQGMAIPVATGVLVGAGANSLIKPKEQPQPPLLAPRRQ